MVMVESFGISRDWPGHHAPVCFGVANRATRRYTMVDFYNKTARGVIMIYFRIHISVNSSCSCIVRYFQLDPTTTYKRREDAFFKWMLEYNYFTILIYVYMENV